jgi:hypothetical protein
MGWVSSSAAAASPSRCSLDGQGEDLETRAHWWLRPKADRSTSSSGDEWSCCVCRLQCSLPRAQTPRCFY